MEDFDETLTNRILDQRHEYINEEAEANFDDSLIVKTFDLNQTNKSVTTNSQLTKLKKKITNKKIREAQSMVLLQRKKAEESIENLYTGIEKEYLSHEHQIQEKKYKDIDNSTKKILINFSNKVDKNQIRRERAQ